MNNLVNKEFDKFKEKTTIELKNAMEINANKGTMMVFKTSFNFRYISMPDVPKALVMDFDCISTGAVNISNGEMIVLIGQEKYSLVPHESYSEPYLQSYHKESCWYEVSNELLDAFCKADSIDIRVTNGKNYADFVCTNQIRLAAKAMYNAIFDESAYLDDLNSASIGSQQTNNKKEENSDGESENTSSKKVLWIIGGVLVAVFLLWLIF